MARVARGEVFDPREVSVFHCINRSVGSCAWWPSQLPDSPMLKIDVLAASGRGVSRR
jgi:hypothetical protein